MLEKLDVLVADAISAVDKVANYLVDIQRSQYDYHCSTTSESINSVDKLLDMIGLAKSCYILGSMVFDEKLDVSTLSKDDIKNILNEAS